MEKKIQGPHSVACYDFVGRNGEKSRVSAIMVPIVIRNNGNGVKITWSCSKATSCLNTDCRYSKANTCHTPRGIEQV